MSLFYCVGLVVFRYVLVVIVFVLCSWFFFFKQKTAYEMRISDWSSDVCSSDLFPTAHVQAMLDGEGIPAARYNELADVWEDEQVQHRKLRARKIGRASCRERVCQYV